MRDSAPDDQPVVIRASRTKLALSALVLGMLIAGAGYFSLLMISIALSDPHALLHWQGRHALLAPFAPVLGPVLTAFFVVRFVRNTVMLVRLPQLEIGPAGIVRREPWGDKVWRWDQAHGLRLDKWRGRLTVNSLRGGGMPDYLDISSSELFELLNWGRQRWAPSPLADGALTA